MKKVMPMVALLAMAFMGALPPASADSYVIAGGVGTKITTLPYTIRTPGFYYLAQNLTYTAIPGNAVTVQADDVTLDLMGFSLTGVGKTNRRYSALR